MDNRTDEKSMQELVKQMAAVQQRSQTLSLIITVVIMVMAAALIVSLAVVVPKITATLDHARTTLTDTQAVIQRISSSLDNLDSIGENLNGLSGEGAEKLGKLIDTLSTIDADALTVSIQRFNGLLEGLSNFKLFG